jgi:hypothetical protein
MQELKPVNTKEREKSLAHLAACADSIQCRILPSIQRKDIILLNRNYGVADLMMQATKHLFLYLMCLDQPHRGTDSMVKAVLLKSA